MNQKIIIGLSVGTGAFIASVVLFLSIVACAVCALHHQSPSVDTRPQPHLRVPLLPRLGDIDDAARKQALDAELGPVNEAAKNEAKHGLFSRLRARRAGCSMSSASCSGPNVSRVNGAVTYYHRNPYVPAYVPNDVGPVVPAYVPLPTGSCSTGTCPTGRCPNIAIEPFVNVQPARPNVAPARPSNAGEIDWSSCVGNNCELFPNAR